MVTGSRADYGLLYPVMKELRNDPCTKLLLVVTGMHLSPTFGETANAIESDGFQIDERIETQLASDTSAGVAKSVGLGIIGFADALNRLKPDLVMLLGDRFEILAAAVAAFLAKVPIAHIGGGDITEGSLDDGVRHSITKLAQLHFVTNAEAARRVHQLGEDSRYIFNVGSPGVDCIRSVMLLQRHEIESILGLSFRLKNYLVTFHPATLDEQAADRQFCELAKALESLDPDETLLIFTMPNSDSGGLALRAAIEDFVSKHDNARLFTSLGQQMYLSIVRQVDAMIGNSSSGLYEAPSFCIPTVNIGDRQKGRVRATSVIDSAINHKSIQNAIEQADSLDCRTTVNPYGDGASAKRIVAALKSIPNPRSLVKKGFIDWGAR